MKCAFICMYKGHMKVRTSLAKPTLLTEAVIWPQLKQESPLEMELGPLAVS